MHSINIIIIIIILFMIQTYRELVGQRCSRQNKNYYRRKKIRLVDVKSVN